MKTTDRHLHSIARLLFAASAFFLSFGVPACRTVPAPKVPPTAAAAIDCALPSLWNAVTPSAVEADVVSAIAQKDPLAALTLLCDAFGEAEVTCVVARRNAAVKAEATWGGAPTVTRQWLDQEAAKGLRVTNFQGMPPG
jgi:hypothetical protein